MMMCSTSPIASLEKYPCLADHLGAKFPYIYVDEFQDTDPRQTQILKWIVETGNSYVGVIGDAEQAIFGFLGARREDFTVFDLPEIREYTISDNWRSTNNIITVLNNARTDGLTQDGLRKTGGSPVIVFVGDISKVYEQVKNSKPVMLTRRNESADLLRTKDFAKKKTAQNPWTELEEIDYDRFLFMKAILEAFMFLKFGRPDSAVRKLLDGFRVRKGISKVLTNAPYITDVTKRALALTILCCLQEKTCFAPAANLFLRRTMSREHGSQDLLPGSALKRITKGKPLKIMRKNTHFNNFLIQLISWMTIEMLRPYTKQKVQNSKQSFSTCQMRRT